MRKLADGGQAVLAATVLVPDELDVELEPVEVVCEPIKKENAVLS